MTHEPTTLGEKLAPHDLKTPGFDFGAWLRNTFRSALIVSLLTAASALPLWWYLMRPVVDMDIILPVSAVLVIFWLIVYSGFRSTRQHYVEPHYLLANDRERFMRDLRLDAKTVIIDGSNIYHFGHDNGLDAQPLAEIAHQLRTEGYRIVCFFDASIFFRLMEHGALPRVKHHTFALLYDIFGLRPDEIYVVPSGVQADQFILESLKHLPISFAVTNDQFRDYATEYAGVMKDQHWRKGVVISKNEIKLLQYRFQNPILIELDRHNRKKLVAAE
ncbi:NYN domain-containing protein [Roseovarius sp. Pro17]|uniref:NYN domain-containing protein n=1 Tax=Roseovarius sp. Pro17 TaxID=3108175 RepID=UPI002D794194|nr:hypothetical protein [Roseovarius sp. Pro17]